MNPQITQMTQIIEKKDYPKLQSMQSGKSVDQSVTGDPRTYAIIGAAMEVHRQLGCGFLEAVYQETLAREFSARDVPHRREVDLPITYKGERLNTAYRADFICFDSIVVEIKALVRLSGVEESQILNYLKASGYEVGLLLNFGTESLQYFRFILSRSPRSAQSAKSAED